MLGAIAIIKNILGLKIVVIVGHSILIDLFLMARQTYC